MAEVIAPVIPCIPASVVGRRGALGGFGGTRLVAGASWVDARPERGARAVFGEYGRDPRARLAPPRAMPAAQRLFRQALLLGHSADDDLLPNGDRPEAVVR